MTEHRKDPPAQRLDGVVERAQRARAEREQGYRERALKLYPWVCGRCGRTFDRSTVRELTVHHRDHDHDNNPADGSNWELLCLYCHDNEHRRGIDAAYAAPGAGEERPDGATHRPFADLFAALKRKEEP
jgi:5-methylcytosine-specific restriction endonuclease McrA